MNVQIREQNKCAIVDVSKNQAFTVNLNVSKNQALIFCQMKKNKLVQV